ncbi:hypothetical protein IGI39_001529 [Enterococcus sp. AZ135]|uniref:hypothetical protein n=1 Tax=unclassified Enterococcus TaxID=2608891 RepID=UPI003F1EE478
MALLLTLLFDLLMIVLFLFRMIRGDQITFIVSIVLQGLLFIDLLAVVLLRSPKVEDIPIEQGEMTRRQSRRSAKPTRSGGFLSKASCLIALLLLAYYIYSVVYLFI